MSKDYYARAYVCPYMKRTSETSIRCESGYVRFEDKAKTKDHIGRFCCDKWQECPIATKLNAFYERKYRTS